MHARSQGQRWTALISGRWEPGRARFLVAPVAQGDPQLVGARRRVLPWAGCSPAGFVRLRPPRAGARGGSGPRSSRRARPPPEPRGRPLQGRPGGHEEGQRASRLPLHGLTEVRVEHHVVIQERTRCRGRRPLPPSRRSCTTIRLLARRCWGRDSGTSRVPRPCPRLPAQGIVGMASRAYEPAGRCASR